MPMWEKSGPPDDVPLRKLRETISNVRDSLLWLDKAIMLYLRVGTDEHRDQVMSSLVRVRASLAGQWPLDPNCVLPIHLKENAATKPETTMQDIEQVRHNFGRHAVLISKDGPDDKPWSVLVWLNADKGNTSRNPEFKAIKSTRTWAKREFALQYGKRLCEAASQKGQDNRDTAIE